MDKLTANELRIGNLVKLRENVLDAMASKIGSVTTIYEDKFVVHNHYPSFWYEPIQLTDEWLIRMGFSLEYKSPMHSTYELLGGKFSYYFWHKTKKQYLLVNGSEQDCKYVHTLQNIVHALTGEELTFKTN